MVCRRPTRWSFAAVPAADQLDALELCDTLSPAALQQYRRQKLAWRAADQRAGALRCAFGAVCGCARRHMVASTKIEGHVADQRAGALRPCQGRRPTKDALELCNGSFAQNRRPAHDGWSFAITCWRRRNRRPTRGRWSFAIHTSVARWRALCDIKALDRTRPKDRRREVLRGLSSRARRGTGFPAARSSERRGHAS